jgi:hypothetical protein
MNDFKRHVETIRALCNKPRTEASDDYLRRFVASIFNDGEKAGVTESISADCTIPPERWFYCDDGNYIGLGTASPCEHCLEVQPADLEYVRAQIERHKNGEIELSEWEYRCPNPDEIIIMDNGDIKSYINNIPAIGEAFVRKAEAKKSGGWKEFEVSNYMSDKFHVIDFPQIQTQQGIRNRTVSEAIAYAIDRGMCPQFLFKGSTTWDVLPSLMFNGKNAKLLKMRVWEEGK